MCPDSHLAPSSADHPTLAIFGVEGVPRPRTLIDIARTAMARYPQAVALDCEGGQLTYAEFSMILDEQVQQLRRHGIGRGDRVGIHVPPGTMQLYVAVLAVVFSGATYVPVDWDAATERVQAVWQAAGVAVVYGPDLELSVHQAKTGAPDTSAPEPGDDAWLLFPGQTTTLQGVATTHHSAGGTAEAQAMAYLADAPLRPGDRIMTDQSITAVPAAKKMWLSWRKGATLVPTPAGVFDSEISLAAWIRDQQITVVATTPEQAAAWPRGTLDEVRLLILTGGERPPKELLDSLPRPGLEIWTGYRATWTAARLYNGTDPDTPPDSVGRPIPGMQMCVIDPEGEPVRWGEIGEVVVNGLGLDRYLDPVTDAEKYPPLPSLQWERARFTGTLVRAAREGLVPIE